MGTLFNGRSELLSNFNRKEPANNRGPAATVTATRNIKIIGQTRVAIGFIPKLYSTDGWRFDFLPPLRGCCSKKEKEQRRRSPLRTALRIERWDCLFGPLAPFCSGELVLLNGSRSMQRSSQMPMRNIRGAQWSETLFRNMDLHNNEVRRQIGLDNRFVTREQ